MMCMLLVLGLVGCGNSGAKINASDVVDRLVANGLSDESIRETDRELYVELYIHDKEVGYAMIRVYKDMRDAELFWNNLSERYDNLKYSDSFTAIGNPKDVYDAFIEEWAHMKDNVVVTVQQYVANEWAIYVGDDGEEYYGDGTKVSDVKSPQQQREDAEKLEQLVLISL